MMPFFVFGKYSVVIVAEYHLIVSIQCIDCSDDKLLHTPKNYFLRKNMVDRSSQQKKKKKKILKKFSPKNKKTKKKKNIF